MGDPGRPRPGARDSDALAREVRLAQLRKLVRRVATRAREAAAT